MSVGKRTASIFTAGIMAVTSIILVTSTANAAGCGVYASQPYKSTSGAGIAKGKIGRSGCSGSVVRIEGRLMHDQPHWADIERASARNSAVNWSATMSWQRPNTTTAKGWGWYTDVTTTSGQKAKSSTVVLWVG